VHVCASVLATDEALVNEHVERFVSLWLCIARMVSMRGSSACIGGGISLGLKWWATWPLAL
jgi:hypothetical protein